MENISKKATDNIELCAIIYDIYKNAQKENMYIIDRRKNNSFGIVLKDMQVSYDVLAIPFERFYDEKEVRVEKRPQYEYSKEDLEKINKYEEFVKTASENPPKTDEEAADIVRTIEEHSAIIQNIKPNIVEKEVPLYINNISGLECPLIALSEFSDEELNSLASFDTDYILHSKCFIQGYQQKNPIMVEFFKVGEWYDAVCV